MARQKKGQAKNAHTKHRASLSAHGLNEIVGRMSKDRRRTPPLTPGINPPSVLSSEYSLAGNNQVLDSPPSAVMAGNLHQQPPPELNEDLHNPMPPAETLRRPSDIYSDLVDDADDNTDAVQEEAESAAAAGDHGVQRDCVDDNPGRLMQEEEPRPVIELAHNIYLPLLSREDVEFIMSLP